MTEKVQLPDYREMSPAVAERFRAIESRETVLQVRNVGKSFPGDAKPPVLGDIGFEVRRREFVSIIGTSGCGKSTLLRCIGGLEAPTSGEILCKGVPVTGPGGDRGMVFQDYSLFPWLTVKRNIMFGPMMRGDGRGASEDEARSWLEMVGLASHADAYPHQLSGGMRQRVAIARALANNPAILMMDEPFGALDSQTRCNMQKHLLQIWRNVDVTILFITHDLDEAILLADRIIVLGARPGRILEIIKVPVERPRHLGQSLNPNFLAVKDRLEHWIHPDADDSAPPLAIRRMTKVGDDVEP
jgi:NitT/TauT family transport system ATP-binding protein